MAARVNDLVDDLGDLSSGDLGSLVVLRVGNEANCWYGGAGALFRHLGSGEHFFREELEIFSTHGNCFDSYPAQTPLDFFDAGTVGRVHCGEGDQPVLEAHGNDRVLADEMQGHHGGELGIGIVTAD